MHALHGTYVPHGMKSNEWQWLERERDTFGVKGKGESRWKDVGEMSKSISRGRQGREGRQAGTFEVQ